jgi:hypothetical protein
MPRKKTKEDDRDVQVALNNWVRDDVHVGTPTMVLLPAANYVFRVLKGEHKITVPRKGFYKELDSDAYGDGDGEFSLFDEKNKVMYMPAISKILFATKQYPDLEPNYLFAPIALVFKKDEVDIIGQVVEMLEPTDIKTSAG